jgi:Flp pilus assembly protein TadD
MAFVRLPEGKAFLQEERQTLKRQCAKGRRNAGLFAALGSVEEFLGNTDDAVACLKQALELQPQSESVIR